MRIKQTATFDEQAKLPYLKDNQFVDVENLYYETDFMHKTLSKLLETLAVLSNDKSGDLFYCDSYASCPMQLLRIAISKFSDTLTEWENF